MNYFELFSSAFSALRSNLLRTLLTMLGIIIGIASVIMIVSIGQGASQSITSQVTSLGSNLIFITPGTDQMGMKRDQATRTDTLVYSDATAIAEKISHLSGVSASTSQSFKVFANGQDANVSVSGVSEDYPALQSLEVATGDFISEDDVTATAKVAVLGSEVVTTFFGENAEPINKNIQIDRKTFRIIGVMKTKGTSGMTNTDQNIYIPVSTAMKTMIGQDYVQVIFAGVDKAELVDETMGNIKTLLLERHKITDSSKADFSISSSKDALSTLNTITSLLTTMLAGIAGISLVVGGIGIMNIMLVTVTERTKEIGLLKAIGAKRKDILTQFLIESIVLTLVGGLIGIFLGAIAAYLISQFINIPFVFQYTSVVLAVGVSSTVGLVFGIYPAAKAARLNPIDALRYE